MSDFNIRFSLRFLIAGSFGALLAVAFGLAIGGCTLLCVFFTITYIDTLCAEISRERSHRLLSIEQAIRQLEGK